jgi:hypothetical protein
MEIISAGWLDQPSQLNLGLNTRSLFKLLARISATFAANIFLIGQCWGQW